jgi:acyl-coenzyme A synthetase/AMP-(fatty) acid ligase
MRTLQGDHARYETTYFAPFKGFYFSGDGCRRSVVCLATLDHGFHIML